MRIHNPIEAAKWLNQNGLAPKDPSDLDPYSWDYNCWGFTAYMLGWEEAPGWLGEGEMEDYLADYSVPVEKPSPGDIAVFRDSWGVLTHTALVIEGPKGRTTPVLVQKPGEMDLEVRTVAGTYKTHTCYNTVSEYRRPVA